MRILYGVVGEGMGHATRSRVILEHLRGAGHHVHVVVSGRAHGFLTRAFAGREHFAIDEIEGLSLTFKDNALALPQSVAVNLEKLPQGIVRNVSVVAALLAGKPADVVISDFESIAYFYARLTGLPVISIDNMQVINRCRHDKGVTSDESFSFRLAKAAVKAKLPGAYHYLVSSFFFPPVRKPRTTLIPPILRQQILEAKREPGAHVLVYQTAQGNTQLLEMLKALPYSFVVYGMGTEGGASNVTLRPFSETAFVDDLRTARAVIAGGGYSLMGEAVHLRVPMLSVPLKGQYEQELNARYLARLGYGAHAAAFSTDVIADFLARTQAMTDALGHYTPRDNTMLFACVDELLRKVALAEPPPDRLETDALGAWEGPALPRALAQALEDDEDETNP